MLITEDYKKLTEELHLNNKDYGTSGQRWANQIIAFSKMVKSNDLLDYGCGKSTLAQNLPFAIKQYDPCVPKHAAPPEPADIVVCTDVLEHIELDCIKDVLADIRRLTKQMVFLSIANGPAKKTLSDGRNAHLIQQNEIFWMAELLPLFHMLQFNSSGVTPDDKNNGIVDYLFVGSPRY